MNIEPRLLRVNFSRGRDGGVDPVAIVVHIQEGTMAGTDSWFRNPASKVSAHYGVSKAGEVVQWVRDEDTAQHAGVVDRPTAAIVRERVGFNPNSYTLGIECEGRATDAPPADQMVALAELVKLLCTRHRIPLDRKHVIGHREVRGSKPCPGRIDVDEVVRLAAGEEVAQVDQQPRTGDRRWSEYLGEHVILTRYAGDRDWHFIRESLLRRMGARGTVPWSEMPAERL